MTEARLISVCQNMVMTAVNLVEDLDDGGMEFLAHLVACYCKAHDDCDDAWEQFSDMVDGFLLTVERPFEMEQ